MKILRENESLNSGSETDIRGGDRGGVGPPIMNNLSGQRK